jgi:hypothetical protein
MRFITTCWICPTSASIQGSDGSSSERSLTFLGTATSRRCRLSRMSALRSTGVTWKWPRPE